MSNKKPPRGYNVEYIGRVLPRQELLQFMDDTIEDDPITTIMKFKEKFREEEGEE